MTIIKNNLGWSVVSEHKTHGGKRKMLGGPYPTKAQAVQRLRQVEYFKHHTAPKGRRKT